MCDTELNFIRNGNECICDEDYQFLGPLGDICLRDCDHESLEEVAGTPDKCRCAEGFEEGLLSSECKPDSSSDTGEENGEGGNDEGENGNGDNNGGNEYEDEEEEDYEEEENYEEEEEDENDVILSCPG